ncbi:MAG TPA: hypothetical protein DCE44_20865, partial [Verrucomicrobiales bacterium]|nr:hypothetical protein [Verrucomicrobiales bacterium]
VGFQLEFWDRQKNEFVPEWLRSNQIPSAVRFSLGFATGSRGPAEIVTRTVRLPDSGVGADLQGGTAPPGGGAPQ